MSFTPVFNQSNEKRLAPGTGLFYIYTVYPKKYAHGFVVLCFVVVMQPFIMNLHEVVIHIHQGCFAGTGAIVRLPQCQWSKPDGYGKISQCITTTKHSKAKTVCIFLGIYYISIPPVGYQQTWLNFTHVSIRHDLFSFFFFFFFFFTIYVCCFDIMIILRFIIVIMMMMVVEIMMVTN